MTNKKLSYEVN